MRFNGFALLFSSFLFLVLFAFTRPAEGGVFGSNIFISVETNEVDFQSCGGGGSIDVISRHRIRVVSTSGSVANLSMSGESRRCNWITTTMMETCNSSAIEFPSPGDILECQTAPTSRSCVKTFCARLKAQIQLPAPDTLEVESSCVEPDHSDCDEY